MLFKLLNYIQEILSRVIPSRLNLKFRHELPQKLLLMDEY